MMGAQSTTNSKLRNWQVYVGVGMLSALGGYLLSALPELIAPAACVGLSVWLIYSGIQENAELALVPSPMEMVRRSSALLMFWRSRLRVRWGRFDMERVLASRWRGVRAADRTPRGMRLSGGGLIGRGLTIGPQDGGVHMLAACHESGPQQSDALRHLRGDRRQGRRGGDWYEARRRDERHQGAARV
jgi:hypothetical protein